MTQSLDIQAANMTLYWQLYQMQFYLGRIQKNLTLIDSAPNAQIITVVGGNLYSIAAQYYADASQWALIASANNLTDPNLSGVTTLVIPPLNNQDTGGIL